MLEDHRDGVAAQLAQLGGVAADDVLARDLDRAGGRLDQPDQRADERRLAGAGEAHDDEHLARPDLDRDVADGGDAAGLRAQLGARQLGVGRADDACRRWARRLPDPLGADERVAVAGRCGGAGGRQWWARVRVICAPVIDIGPSIIVGPAVGCNPAPRRGRFRDNRPMADLVIGADGLARCWWCGDDPLYRAYHDDDWGRELRGDDALFELLSLEGFQAGLSWITILRSGRRSVRRSRGSRSRGSRGTASPTSSGCSATRASSAIAARSRRRSGTRVAALEIEGGLRELVWSFAPPPRAAAGRRRVARSRPRRPSRPRSRRS